MVLRHIVAHRRPVCRIKDNTVAAIDFKKIKAPSKAGERKENETERGLRVADKVLLDGHLFLGPLLAHGSQSTLHRDF